MPKQFAGRLGQGWRQMVIQVEQNTSNIERHIKQSHSWRCEPLVPGVILVSLLMVVVEVRKTICAFRRHLAQPCFPPPPATQLIEAFHALLQAPTSDSNLAYSASCLKRAFSRLSSSVFSLHATAVEWPKSVALSSSSSTSTT